MREWLVLLTEQAVVLIDLIALLVIVAGTLQALAGGAKAMTALNGHLRRDVWLRYGRWLIAGLTFQLAADIVETAITTDWEAIGRVGAIAVIRTFLNYFLERDLAEMRERQHATGAVRESHSTEPP